MYVCFTGGRYWKDEKAVRQVMALIGHDAKVFVGDCPTGLDAMVQRLRGKSARVFVADWSQFGRSAGPIRNEAMLFTAQEEAARRRESLFLVAFPGGAGTANCVKIAHSKGIPVLRFCAPFEEPHSLVQEMQAHVNAHLLGQTGDSVGLDQESPEAPSQLELELEA